MDISLAGAKEGLIKALKVGLYIAASGAITALISEVTKLQATAGEWAAIYALINMILAGAKTWLTTKR